MGLTTWKNSPKGKILKSDISIAKNYLTEKEVSELNRLVELYLNFAELQAERNIPMKMTDSRIILENELLNLGVDKRASTLISLYAGSSQCSVNMKYLEELKIDSKIIQKVFFKVMSFYSGELTENGSH